MPISLYAIPWAYNRFYKTIFKNEYVYYQKTHYKMLYLKKIIIFWVVYLVEAIYKSLKLE